jgi:hypothetical protein
MPTIARGTAGALLLMLLAALTIGAGCAGAKNEGSSPHPALATSPLPTTPAPVVPSRTAPDLSLPPPTAAPLQPPPVDPIVGKWYAAPPDDLTFEFFSDGTFRETSPGFRPYLGTWGISEEGEEGFYDAVVLDQWGFRKQVHILRTSGALTIKSMGTLHRVV